MVEPDENKMQNVKCGFKTYIQTPLKMFICQFLSLAVIFLHSDSENLTFYTWNERTKAIVSFARVSSSVCVRLLPVKLLRHDSPGRSFCSHRMNSVWLCREYRRSGSRQTHTSITCLKTGNSQEVNDWDDRKPHRYGNESVPAHRACV